jgi:hypothetical protein
MGILKPGMALGLSLIGVLLLNGLCAAAAPPSEYQVKAVFLFNFAQFVEWPSESRPEAGEPFVIGVLGGDPFGSSLDEVVRGEKIAGHPLVVKRYQAAQEIDDACHILFISRSESEKLKPILVALKGRQILTVSDIDDAAGHGVMIRLLLNEKNKLRLAINVQAAKAAGLTISSKLLRPAEIVTSDKG